MAASRDPADATVTPLRRPPVRQSTVVRSDLNHTFEVFVRTIGLWWPVQPFSAGQDQVRDVTVAVDAQYERYLAQIAQDRQ